MPDVLISSPAENGKRLKLTRQILDVVDGVQTWRDSGTTVLVPAGLCSLQPISNTHQRFVVELIENDPPAPASGTWLNRIPGLGKK